MAVQTGMEDCGIDDSFKYNLYSVVYSVVFILGLVTNCAALFVFCFRMKMHGLCKVSGTAFITNIYGSMLFLTCISVDRFLAIVYPFRSRSIRTRRNAALVCAAVWLTIVGGAFPSRSSPPSTANTEPPPASRGPEILVVLFDFSIVGFLCPLLANLVCSSLVLRTLRRPVTVGHSENKQRVLRMIVVHLSIFIVCFVPYNSILFLYALVRTQALANCGVERFARTLYPITLCMASLNCCLDPVVYYFTSESFKKSLTLDLNCRDRDKKASAQRYRCH
uniref:Lysophosphatidic acid receptor 4 n=1 Tax=Neogobius melanostomus TaxID=47308 RepID=A0A8C6SRH2_9GOBI